MNKFAIAALTLVATSSAAFAQSKVVPEIDAAAGVAAFAALAGVVAIVRNRFKG